MHICQGLEVSWSRGACFLLALATGHTNSKGVSESPQHVLLAGVLMRDEVDGINHEHSLLACAVHPAKPLQQYVQFLESHGAEKGKCHVGVHPCVSNAAVPLRLWLIVFPASSDFLEVRWGVTRHGSQHINTLGTGAHLSLRVDGVDLIW